MQKKCCIDTYIVCYLTQITLESIKEDSSERKQDSHNKLLVMVTRRGDIFENTYTKKEIEVLFYAYGLHYYVSWTKSRLNAVLVESIKAAAQFVDPSVFRS